MTDKKESPEADADLFGNRRFADIVRSALTKLGGRASHDDLVAKVRKTITLDEYDAWAKAAFRTAVISRSKAGASQSGVDAVYAIGGESVQLRLLEVDEIKGLGYKLARQSVANRNAVFALSEACEKIHGRTFDAEAVIADVQAEAS